MSPLPSSPKTVLTFGVFDMLHIGHILLFKRARGLGDALLVAVQDDREILKYKPDTKVIYNTEDRIFMVSSIRYVNRVCLYHDVDIDIQNLDFDILAIGQDQTHPGFMKAVQWCQNHGKEVIRLPRTEGISSTLLRDYQNTNEYPTTVNDQRVP